MFHRYYTGWNRLPHIDVLPVAKGLTLLIYMLYCIDFALFIWRLNKYVKTSLLNSEYYNKYEYVLLKYVNIYIYVYACMFYGINCILSYLDNKYT